MDDESISPENLDGLTVVRERVAERIHEAAVEHEHLDADELSIVTMYIVGSIGAGKGRKGSDLDLVVMLRYTGDASGPFGWEEYVQDDIETALQRNRAVLAEPLPSYVGYIDPKLGDQIDCEMFVRQMSQHGEYDVIYDLYEGSEMRAGQF